MAAQVEPEVRFGGADGLVEMTIKKPGISGDPVNIDIFARIGEQDAICARVSSPECFLTIRDINKPDARGKIFNRGATRQEMSKPLRFAVKGKGCALNICNGWVLLSQVPEGHESGNFMVKIKETNSIKGLSYSS